MIVRSAILVECVAQVAALRASSGAQWDTSPLPEWPSLGPRLFALGVDLEVMGYGQPGLGTCLTQLCAPPNELNLNAILIIVFDPRYMWYHSDSSFLFLTF